MHIDNNFGIFCFLLSHIKNNHLLMPDGKKVSGHVATPFPTKQAGKALAKNDKSKQTPKSSGTFECKSCKRYDSLFKSTVICTALNIFLIILLMWRH